MNKSDRIHGAVWRVMKYALGVSLAVGLSAIAVRFAVHGPQTPLVVLDGPLCFLVFRMSAGNACLMAEIGTGLLYLGYFLIIARTKGKARRLAVASILLFHGLGAAVAGALLAWR